MNAVFITGGKQYRVSEGDRLRVERLDAKEGEAIDFDTVLVVSNGDEVQVGAPYVEGGRVSAIVSGHGRGDKVMVVKFKRRKGYLRRKGHRQHYTELTISAITTTETAAAETAINGELAASVDAPSSL
ncbi:MAG: 50S ribosomal protein L21 [Gammaproteobacteria bacterium]|nr:50S ribosomal protein L21 [Gammaproteobacteria bacterium]